jgi:transposase-like protein
MEAITTEVVDTGRKREVQGRRIVTAQERVALLAAYQQSGMTQRAFAQSEGINYSTFTAWLQGRRRAADVMRSAPAKVRFAEVRLPGRTAADGVEVRLPDGTVVRGAGAREVAEVVRALRT